MKILEKQVEAYLCKRIKELGGICEKFTSPSKRSVPDRIVTQPGGIVTFVELKSPQGKPTEKQLRDHALRKKLGARVVILSSYEEIDSYFPRLQKK